jgi:hypothetical protein
LSGESARSEVRNVVYRGYGGYNGTRVTVQVNGGEPVALEHRVRHSPSGFAWGYGGSGPADLARSLLMDYIERVSGPDFADELPVSYQQFKFDVVARWPWDPRRYANSAEPVWELPGEDIENWLASQRQVTQ